MKKSLVLLAAVVAVSSSVAMAGALATKATQKEFQAGTVSYTKDMNDACGTKITMTVDMSKFKPDPWKGYSPACQMVADGIKNLCKKSDDYKGAVASKIKTVKCMPNGGEAGSVKLNGSTVEYVVPPSGDLVGDDKVTTILSEEVDK